ncbi:MAG: DNA mismatch repair protein MutS [Myxococcota bacterium]|nr:DNA mismatch repair protein MutS [Myxococcota bacterium]
MRLALFGAAVAATGIGLSRGSQEWLIGGALAFLAFFGAVIAHALVVQKRDRALTRQTIHERHLLRIEGRTQGFPHGGELLASDHSYASDLDVVGPGSLFERITVTHTRRGAETLARWLGAPADRATVLLRQEAVRELAADVDLRQELEAAVLDTGTDSLDARPFLELAQRPPFVTSKPWLRALSFALPIATIVLLVLSGRVLPTGIWLLPLAAQGILVWRTGHAIAERYALLSSRRRFVESFAAMLRVVERTEWKAPLLRSLQESLRIEGKTPSEQLRGLERWTSLFDLRTQGIVHVFVDLFLLWDLHCLAGVERWMQHAGQKCGTWFEVVGEIEALASLATLLHGDAGVVMPEITEPGSPMIAQGIAHPLIPAERRVRNDLRIEGPGHALVVTGSNMAGKSTLLRALGVDVALALAGGPVCATSFSTPPVRLRASMRISDSVQSGASYFQAELTRLRTVIAGADEPPPLLFLLDELLRGTNARARHKGARAVVKHLLARGAMGLVATHDVALSDLDREMPGRVGNVHFTDVFENGEMTFDYRLRDGVVKTSNALRLLQQAGIEVDADDALTDAPPAAP